MVLKADINDVSILNLLVNSAYRGETSKLGWTTEADLLDGIRVDDERLTEQIEKPGSLILKCLDEQQNIVGCVHLEKKGRKLYLGMLAVAPIKQGRGIGKKLMNSAEEHARKLNCISIYMTVITDRTELIAWYERYGYSDTGETKPFPEGDPRFGLPKKHLEFVVLEKKI